GTERRITLWLKTRREYIPVPKALATLAGQALGSAGVSLRLTVFSQRVLFLMDFLVTSLLSG
ncbi:MAG TPA: hypothetical protein VIC08_05970, partial [Cellvibrionaceae bacterium]